MNKTEKMKMIVDGKVVEDTEFSNREMYGNKLIPTEDEAKILKTKNFGDVKYWYLKMTDDQLFDLFNKEPGYFVTTIDRVAFNANKFDEDYVMTFVNHFWFCNKGKMKDRDDWDRQIYLNRIFKNYRFSKKENLEVFAKAFKKNMFMIEPEEECLNSKWYKWEWFGLHNIEEWKEEATITYEQMDNWNKMKEFGLC